MSTVVLSGSSFLGSGIAQKPNLRLTSSSEPFFRISKISSAVKSSLFNSLAAKRRAAWRKSPVAARSTSTVTGFSTMTSFSTTTSFSTISAGFDSSSKIRFLSSLLSLDNCCTSSEFSTFTIRSTGFSLTTYSILGTSISLITSTIFSTGTSTLTSFMISRGLALFSFSSLRICFWSSAIFFFEPLLFLLG